MSLAVSKVSKISQQFINIGVILLIVLMPFHAFFSVYLGSLGFDRFAVQSWKEGLVLVLVFAWLIYQAAAKKIAFKLDSINLLFIAVVFISLFTTIYIRPTAEAVLLGIKTNLVAIALFFIAQIPRSAKSYLRRNVSLFIIIPGLLVSVLAILQFFVISPEFMTKLGYNISTINPQQIIDSALKFYRAFSTLGGPNQLGAYLIIPISFCLVYGIKNKNWWLLISSLLLLTGLILSFSRSAWIGSAIAIFVAVFVSISKKQKIYFSIASALVLIIAASFIATQFRSNQKIQNLIFHGSIIENSIYGSDTQRISAAQNTIKEIIANPFGHGLGSAGPSSFKSQKVVIPENWYLQIAYEVGVIGLLLYVSVFILLLIEFMRNLSNPLSASLLSATLGILAVNLFLQSWADSTLVLIMFALYGISRSKNQ